MCWRVARLPYSVRCCHPCGDNGCLGLTILKGSGVQVLLMLSLPVLVGACPAQLSPGQRGRERGGGAGLEEIQLLQLCSSSLEIINT